MSAQLLELRNDAFTFILSAFVLFHKIEKSLRISKGEEFAMLYFIPASIRNLCLEYSGLRVSYFYLRDTLKYEIDEDIFKPANDERTLRNISGATWDNHSIFGVEKIVSDSNEIRAWSFNIQSDNIVIGVCSTEIYDINQDFTKSTSKGDPVFYAVNDEGNAFTNHKQAIHAAVKSGNNCWEFGPGDQITLTLHLEFGRVMLQVNDGNMIIVFANIQKSKELRYHLAMQMPEKDDFVALTLLLGSDGQFNDEKVFEQACQKYDIPTNNRTEADDYGFSYGYF